jgi:hypothetical protein
VNQAGQPGRSSVLARLRRVLAARASADGAWAHQGACGSASGWQATKGPVATGDLALASIVSFTLMAEVERRRQLVYHTGRLSPIGERV